MSRMIVAINERRAARGGVDLKVGVGIATGEVVAGTIGSPKRMDYTVIGDSVNLASRLEGITKMYKVGIVVCEETAQAVAGTHAVRELDTIKVRGRQRPAKIFQVLTGDAPVPQSALDAYAAQSDPHNQARVLARLGEIVLREGDGDAVLDVIMPNALAAGEWGRAIAAFEAALAAAPNDGPSAVMLARARILEEDPPAADWDGVWDSAKAA